MRWLFFLFSFTLCAPVQAEKIKVALPFEGNPPYSFGENDHRGIYIEIFKEIFKSTPYQLEFIYLSSARIRTNFNEGKIDIECCPIPAWRKSEKAISLYSQKIFKSEDVYVFPQGKVRDITALDNETIATINGYGYAFDSIFTRYDVESELKLLKLVNHKRLNLGIVDKIITAHFINKYQLAIEIGGVHEYLLRPLRVHKSKAHIMPELNKSIDRAISQGKFQAIINHYTR